MSPSTFPLNAEQAGQAVQQLLRRQRRMRRLPSLPASVQEIADSTKIRIFNVGPWPLRRELGSWGVFFIPECPEGKPYVAGPVIDGIFTEPIPTDESKFELHQYEGRYVAEQILGIGKHLARNASFLHMGAFIAAADEPTGVELKEARAALGKTYLSLYQEALSAYQKGPKEAEQTIDERHRLAAMRLNHKDAPFLSTYFPEERQECPVCGTVSQKRVILCPQCRYVFDEAAWAKVQKRIAPVTA